MAWRSPFRNRRFSGHLLNLVAYYLYRPVLWAWGDNIGNFFRYNGACLFYSLDYHGLNLFRPITNSIKRLSPFLNAVIFALSHMRLCSSDVKFLRSSWRPNFLPL